MKLINKIIFFFLREFKISIKNINDLFINIIFFILGIFIFIFSVGPDKEVLNSIGIGILWTLLLLSFTLSLKKYYQEDFENGALIVIHMSGLSYELIVILKIFSNFIFVQLPFLIIIPLASLFVDLSYNKLILLLLSFFIGSLILSCLGSISASMNLLNKRNFTLGSLIVMIFSIPIIIFSLGLVNAEINFSYYINILIGILLIFFAISPWTSAQCIKLALANN
tara:strand:- start:15 stop:686 length:672 start_codon:yes stop_codon:yes gene_type:complete